MTILYMTLHGSAVLPVLSGLRFQSPKVSRLTLLLRYTIFKTIHLLWEIIFGLQELNFLAKNTRFTRRDGQKHPCRLFSMLPVLFRGLSGVVFRFSRVVFDLSMLPVLRTF